MCVLSWHGGVIVNVFRRLLSLGGALAFFAGAQVLALEEQKAAAPPPADAVEAPKAEVQNGTALIKPDAGTEIRIPGLGKLGTLPKMDFGLELLYGAADGKQPDITPQDIDPGDLTIRGSVKHNF
jgi:hypothetical protein